MAQFQQIDYGFIRVASAIPQVNVADIDFNVSSIASCYQKALEAGSQVLVLPELCVTAYTCADLFGNNMFLEQVERGIEHIRQVTAGGQMLLFIGAPLRLDGHLYNCAIALYQGKVLGVVPKTYLPNHREFYEKRWFTSSNTTSETSSIELNGEEVPFGTDLVFDAGKMKVAAELCEDLWAPVPPSSLYAIYGANVIVNLSASNELTGKHEYLLNLIKCQSSRCLAAYVYSASGYGESSTDLVFAGNAIIAENGTLLREASRFERKAQVTFTDVDIESLNNERRLNGCFADTIPQFERKFRHIKLHLDSPVDYDQQGLSRSYSKLPFVPENKERLDAHCREIVHIQTAGLMRRLEFTHIKSLVVGVSGGLDSTLALLVAISAFDSLGYDRKNIYGITMPGFGTTGRTYNNALHMMKALGITVKEISIAKAVTQHFKDIEQDINKHDVTFENGQARERTQILMDFGNKMNALVLGTGDLSELALGWATYNGDHMSMYNVNSSIPKTLVQNLVRWFASETASSNRENRDVQETLLDVLDTPISPELTPADDQGHIKQKTEDLVGPYQLHDFFLFHMIRYGFGPRKLFLLAKNAFGDEYDNKTLKKWLTKFICRFFSQQFKRSCLPDGPKVGRVSLSPRGDWRMPSDASSDLWIKECNNLPD